MSSLNKTVRHLVNDFATKFYPFCLENHSRTYPLFIMITKIIKSSKDIEFINYIYSCEAPYDNIFDFDEYIKENMNKKFDDDQTLLDIKKLFDKNTKKLEMLIELIEEFWEFV